MKIAKNNKGLNVVELLISLCIISLIITMAVPGFQAFTSRMEIGNGLRAVTSALSTARYKAIMMNRRVKFTIEENRIVLKEKENDQWQEFMHFDLQERVSYSINASPVFSPAGSASPLCSIYVGNRNYNYKITLSFAGRIKVAQISAG